jgi:Cu+-exporting ATPase
LRQFVLSCIFTVPIVILTALVARLVDSDEMATSTTLGTLPYYNIALQLLATPVQFYFGMKFYKGAYKALKNRNANMDVLVALGTTAAYGMGTFMNIIYLTGYEHEESKHYLESAHSFETSAVLITIILLGKYLESRSKMQTTTAITKLAKLQVSDAVIVYEDKEYEIDVNLLEVGDIMRVYPGATIPVDGVVMEGNGWTDEAMMTGEAEQVLKLPDTGVFGGTQLVTGNLIIRVEKLGKDSALSKIIELVE